MNDSGSRDLPEVDVTGLEEFIGRIAFPEGKIAVAGFRPRDEREPGPARGVGADARGVHAPLPEFALQEFPEGIAPDFSEERGADAQPRKSDSDVRRSASRMFQKSGRIYKRNPRLRRHQIHDHFADARNLSRPFHECGRMMLLIVRPSRWGRSASPPPSRGNRSIRKRSVRTFPASSRAIERPKVCGFTYEPTIVSSLK